MTRITLRELLDHAGEHGYGLPAFNVNNMEQIIAILRAARAVESPAILQVSRGARSYAGDAMVRALMGAAEEMFPDVPLCVHQDHGNSFDTCRSAIDQDYTSVMMDGSLREDATTPTTYDENLAVTLQVVEYAHARGVSVEGELGVLGRLDTGRGEQEDGHGATGTLDRSQLLTDPDQAVDFVERTQVDALAIAMGTSHGAYKFSERPDSSVLDMDVVKQINQRLPDLHLVMHGSSSVPQELQDVFNQYGGDLPQTYGVPVEEIQEGIRHGVRKVNIDTDTRLAMTGAMRRLAQTDRKEFDPRKWMAPAMEALTTLCRSRYEQFGSAGMAPRLSPRPLAEMAARYASGELAHRPAD
ncbi:class II fructose-bisphosphate aldolase [Nocardioides sp.]|uniref:class II fructose-bisphosphate aldolase n=1 Tax=Nocardioides sp. TaxID=35761 RepID=UPI00352984E0